MGNFTQNPAAALTQALGAGYHRVRFQQGKPILDRELNLASDLASPQRLALNFVGNGVRDAASFRISGLDVAAGDFTIEPGLALVNGLEVTLTAPTTYRTQPIQTGLPGLVGPTSFIHLRVATREVAAAQDPALGNPGDVGFETAVRDRIEWQVVALPALVAQADHLLLAEVNIAASTIVDRRLVGLNVAAITGEIVAARGSTASLRTRLDRSLAPDGTLGADTVGTTALVDNAVTAAKLRSHATDDAQRAVSRQHIRNAAVSLTQLAATVVFDGDVSVPAAQAGGQPGEALVVLEVRDAAAMHLISVRYVGPRPAPGSIPPFVATVGWTRRVMLLKPFQLQIHAHRHEVLLQNPMQFVVTARVRALRIEEA